MHALITDKGAITQIGFICQALFYCRCTVVRTQSSIDFSNSIFLCNYIFHNNSFEENWQMGIMNCKRKKVLDRCIFFNTSLKTCFKTVVILLKSAV